MDKIYKNTLYILWIIGVVTIGFILYKYFCIKQESSLLSSFGIIISAFLASVIMARSYAQNERFKTEEKDDNEFKIKKFALLSALDTFCAYSQNDGSLKTLQEIKHEYINRIEISSELLKEVYDNLYLAIELLYEEQEEVIITKVASANNKLIEQANLLEIKHPFKMISL